MVFWIHFIYWLHWTLDILFVLACLSVIFHPVFLARLYILIFLGQQLVLNGCLMSWLENKAEAAAGWPTATNQFIMAEVLHGPIVTVYKFLFLTVAIWQLYEIIKEIKVWIEKKKAARRLSSSAA
ncbi:MAG: hypothetical protein ACYDER_29310 [Ktedonobacteraceae bacterium]